MLCCVVLCCSAWVMRHALTESTECLHEVIDPAEGHVPPVVPAASCGHRSPRLTRPVLGIRAEKACRAGWRHASLTKDTI